MKKLKKSAPLLLLILLFVLIALVRQNILSLMPTVIMQKDGGYTQAQIDTLEEKLAESGENLAFCFFSEEKGGVISSGTQSVGGVKITSLKGQTSLVLGQDIISGRLPLSHEAGFVLVSEAAALKLWGGTGIFGQIIVLNDKEFPVAGIFKSKERELIGSFEPKEGHVFTVAEFSFEKADTLEEIKEFLTKKSFSDYSFMLSAVEVRTILSLPLLILGLLIVIPSFLMIYKSLVKNLSKGKKSLVFFAILFIFALALPFLLSLLPPDWVPNTWSDFSFYGSRMEYLGLALEKMMSMQSVGKYINIKPLLFYYLTAYILAFVLAGLNLSRFKIYLKGRESNATSRA